MKSTQFIPWSITPNLVLGQKALADCFHDLSDKNPNLYLFLVRECGDLLDLEESTASYIPSDILTPPVAGIISLGPNFSYTKTKACVGKAGCYAYLSKQGDILYIGSNTDYVYRMKNHYKKSKELNRMFYTFIKQIGGFQHCDWAPVLPFDNLAIKYQQEGNTLSGYDLEAIKFVTQFRARAVEQALMNYFKPKYNSESPVLFNKFWYYAELEDQDNVLVINESGDTKKFTSLLKASLYTGLSDNHIRNVCNCTTPIYAYSSTMEEYVHFVVKFRPMVAPKPKERFGSLKGFDLNTLPSRSVSVLSCDKVWLGESYTYTHPTQAKLELGLVFTGDVASIVNRDRQVFSTVLNAHVYLAARDKSLGYKHLEAQAKQVKVTNTSTSEVQIFQRQSDVHKPLGMSNKTVMKYLMNGETYKGYTFEYID